MHPIVQDLYDSLQWASAGPATDNELQKRALRPVELSPWTVWTFLSLIEHTERQRWLAGVMRTRLQTSPGEIARFARSQELPSRGVVPGLMDWTYYFHGRGCCLTNRNTGESIDVDFHDDSADWIDAWFYIYYLESLKSPSPLEARLLELHSPANTVKLAIDELLDKGLLQRQSPRSGAFCISAAAEQLTEPIALLHDVFRSGKTLRVAVAVGDWLLAAAHSNECESAEIRDALDVRALSAKDEWVRRALPKSSISPEALSALCALNPPELEATLRQVLRGDPGPTMNQALDHLAAHVDQRWLDDLFTLFSRLPIEGDIPISYAIERSATILLNQGYRQADIIAKLRTATHRGQAAIALLMLEYAPQFARVHFHRALRSQIPLERQESAAMLAILAEPWCREELTQALSECQDQTQAAPLRAALTNMHDAVAREAALLWERNHPYTPEQGPWYSMAHVSISSADSWLNHHMDEFHERVLPLRGRVQ